MASPSSYLNSGNYKNQNQSSHNYTYPADLSSAPYFMSFHFVKYIREVSTGVRFQPIGNIFLPIPVNVSEEFGIGYNNADMGILGGKGGLMDALKVGQDAIGATMQRVQNDANGILRQDKATVSQAGRDLAQKLGLAATLLLPDFMKDTSVGRFAAQNLGFVQNPHLTTIFERVELRRHNFTWTFSPRSQDDSRNLEHLINAFRTWSHPRFTQQTNMYALDFPYQVYCNFVNTPFLFPVKRAVITNISVDNGAGGQMAFYKGGAPVAIKLSIQMQETEILTAHDFENTQKTDGSYAEVPIEISGTQAQHD